MHSLEHLMNVLRANPEKESVIWQGRAYRYAWLYETVSRWDVFLEEQGVKPGSVVSVEADFSPNAIGLLLALIRRSCIVVPLTASVEVKKSEFREIAQVETVIGLADGETSQIRRTGARVEHELLLRLRLEQRPGLILFSSGSTGKSKAVVHDLVPLLEKFTLPRKTLRTMTFLLFDHIGGINTLLYSLSNSGCVVTVQERLPDAVCAEIERHKVQLLPTSPTFLNLLLVSEAYRRHDLSSLELVTYGTEVMPESTLKRFHELFPKVRLLQTYGLSEVGILRSTSRSSDSLWVKVGGDGFKTRDAVEVDGEYFRILGRKSELINVGGEKVYPVEVESVLQAMEGVEDASVKGESNTITGQIVAARVKLRTSETVSEFRNRMFAYCRERLPRFKIPQKVFLVSEDIHGDRFKKLR